MSIITIDLETYYDKEYSLSKLTTEEYVRSEKFQLIGGCIKRDIEAAVWYTGKSFVDVVSDIDFANEAILCHNTAFDGAILSWRYGVNPKLWLDTLSMARPKHLRTTGCSLDALSKHYSIGHKGREVHDMRGKRLLDFSQAELSRYADYCINDTELTRKLFDELIKGFPRQELITIDQVLRMFTEPTFELDQMVLDTRLAEIKLEKQRLMDTLGDASTEEGRTAIREKLMSNEKFATLLRQRGIEPPTKISPRTGKTAYAFSKTDEAFLELREHSDPLIVAAVTARLGVKSTLEETRCESFIGISKRTTEGKLPILLNYAGAHTSRFSGGDGINLQNLNRGGALRRALKAPEGYVVIASDLSQIEARLLAYVSGQDDLVEAFAQGRDIYSEFATDVYDRTITKEHKAERYLGKTCILGLGFGVGHIKLRKTLAIGQGGISVSLEEAECQRVVNLYRNKNRRIKQFWGRCGDALFELTLGNEGYLDPKRLIKYANSSIILPCGTVILYPGLEGNGSVGYTYKNRTKLEHIYGGKVTENIMQALAAGIIREHMRKIKKRYKVVLQVHDEVVCVVREDELEEAKAFIEMVMSTPPTWATDLPIACEIKSGFNYGDCK